MGQKVESEVAWVALGSPGTEAKLAGVAEVAMQGGVASLMEAVQMAAQVVLVRATAEATATSKSGPHRGH